MSEKNANTTSTISANECSLNEDTVLEPQGAAVETNASPLRAEDTPENPAEQNLPLAFRIWGGISVALGVISVPLDMLMIGICVTLFRHYQSLPEIADLISTQSLALHTIAICAQLILTAMFVVFGLRLLLNKRKSAAPFAHAMIAVALVCFVFEIMINGLAWTSLYYLAVLLVLVIMDSYLDPSLREERQLQRKLQKLEAKSAAEDGTLGLDKSGKGYITLNFFNIFWIFVVASIAGLIMESIYCPLVNGGIIQNRTGMLWGPFSPIYGVGATLMTVALNRFHKQSWIIITLVSALIGGAFEYLVSWFFQFAFGIVAWNYSDAFMNIDGRTDLFHMVCWGLLGLCWIKLCLPAMLKLINKIPWNWRYGVTVVAASFMFINAAMTMMSFECWYARVAGGALDTPVAQFFAEHYDDSFMENHFESMSIDPSNATRH